MYIQKKNTLEDFFWIMSYMQVERTPDNGDSNRCKDAWFQASTVKEMRNVFFWVIMQWVEVIPYQHFGAKILDPWRWDWQVILKRQ
jgi:hypothetical protein